MALDDHRSEAKEGFSNAAINADAGIVIGRDKESALRQMRLKKAQEVEEAEETDTRRRKDKAKADQEAQNANADKEDAGQSETNGNPIYCASAFTHAVEACRWGISDRGDYVRLRPDKKGQLSKDQIKKAILKGVLEKGWNRIHFYKGDVVDKQAIQLAHMVIGELKAEASLAVKTNPNYPMAEFLKRPIEISDGRMPLDELPACFRRRHERAEARERKAAERAARKTEHACAKAIRKMPSYTPLDGARG